MSDRCFPITTEELQKRIFSLTEAIILLAEHINQVNANSNAPYSLDLEEKIKKILN